VKNGPCENCAYYRPPRNLEELLGFPDSPGITRALETLRDSESQYVRAEAAQKRVLEGQRNEVWPSQPMVAAYCALHEDEGVFRICEVKNAGNRCTDFKTTRRLLFCDTCRHREEAPGPAEHLERLEDVRSAASDFWGEGAAASICRSYDSVQQQKDSAISREIQQALLGGGTTCSFPRYYDHCNKYSTTRKWVLCRWKNHHGLCPGHSQRASASSVEDDSGASAERKPARVWREGSGF
jgi:hypothetical protein